MQKYNNFLTAEELRYRLDYNPETGVFIWKNPPPMRREKIGKEAGVVLENGYRQITVNRKGYQSARLAWLYFHGEWPTEDIDHINGNKTDNRISNLRQATRSQNNANKPKQKNNTSGYKGVCRGKSGWEARIRVNKKPIFLGVFSMKEEAAYWYNYASEYYHKEFGRAA